MWLFSGGGVLHTCNSVLLVIQSLAFPESQLAQWLKEGSRKVDQPRKVDQQLTILLMSNRRLTCCDSGLWKTSATGARGEIALICFMIRICWFLVICRFVVCRSNCICKQLVKLGQLLTVSCALLSSCLFPYVLKLNNGFVPEAIKFHRQVAHDVQWCGWLPMALKQWLRFRSNA